MRCDDFRARYPEMVSSSARADHPRRDDWNDHLDECDDCGDWYQEQQVRDRGADPARFPCVHIAYHLTRICQEHDDPWECPDYVLVYSAKYDEYGIPIRDGGTSQVHIQHCPWCGIKLPSSKRDLWFETLASLGYDAPWEQDIPEEFETDEWWRRLEPIPGRSKK